MDLAEINKIIDLMEERELSELEWEEKGVRFKLKRAMGSGASSLPVPAAVSGEEKSCRKEKLPANLREIISPMVGRFYLSPSPEVSPLVEVGQEVKKEDVVCIIEAMKIMNEIAADMEGEIVEILVESGQPVEFGQPLFRLRVL